MAKNLILIESPGKIKTLTGFLGKDYKVLASMGHIRVFQDTGKYNLGIDIDGEFDTKMKVDSGKSKVVKEIKEAAKKADTIYISTDPDREGEAIAADLYDILPKQGKTIHRVTFNEITKTAVTEALSKPGKIDWDLVNSARTRAIVDRIMGYRLSAVVRSKVSAKSAGRVQSAALRIISEREIEIQKFVPVTYYELFLDFKDKRKNYTAQYYGTNKKKNDRIEGKGNKDKVVKELNSGKYIVGELETKQRKVNAKPAYTTSSFQQDMSAKINMAPKKSMRVAQSLYEGVNIGGNHTALITYMRTDSTRVSDDFIDAGSKYIKEKYGKEYLGVTKKSGKKEGSQDAHEGIRPTDISIIPEDIRAILSVDEFKVYDLIWKRAVASLMSPALIEDRRLPINNGKHVFEMRGKEVLFPGFQTVYVDYEGEEDSKNSDQLPDLKKDSEITNGKLREEEKQTQPPRRYTEASLIKEMEKLGIGRPSTYASVLDTLKSRGYSDTKGKTMFPTEEGIKLSKFLMEYFNDMISYDYTAKMETMLDEIAGGEIDHLEELKKFYNELVELIQETGDFVKEAPKKAGKNCPKCGAEMVIRKGRYGEFHACSRYPACKHTEAIVDETAPKCDVCNVGLIVQRVNKKKQKFYACNNFPKCKTAYSVAEYNEKFGGSDEKQES